MKHGKREYEPPQALRLDEMNTGVGSYCASGLGAVGGVCENGAGVQGVGPG